MSAVSGGERILVTGAGGLIGQEIVRALIAAPCEVMALVRPGGRAFSGAVPAHQLDLTDRGALRRFLEAHRPSTVIHAAWITDHGRFWSAPENLDWVADGLHFLRLCADAGVRRYVGLGSCAEYDPNGDAPREERSSAIAPQTLYGTAKDALRRLGETYAAGVGLSFAWARIFFPYGGMEPPQKLVPSLAASFLAGTPALMSSGVAVRDYIHVRDCGAAIAALARSRVEGTVNIGSGEAVSLRTIGETLARIAGREDLLRIGALPDRPGEPAHLVGDVTRLRGEVGFRAAFSLEEGLSEAFRFWQARAAR